MLSRLGFVLGRVGFVLGRLGVALGPRDFFRYQHVGFAGIFLENNFKYQNAHNNEFGGAISANYGGFFTISCLLYDIFRGGMAPCYLV